MSVPNQAAALRVAIVGAGPSGLYAAVELLRRDARATVELYDRQPCFGGLVRSGVSPDHAERRRVSAFYERLALASGRFRFHGNVEIGERISHADLCHHHDAVIYASGLSADRSLGIAGEDLPGSHAASDFVAWYNGHPDHAQRHYDFDHERAVVVGNGNVALDVARMLLLGAARLRHTDIAEHALQALAGSRIREVVILGRRGPAQASFTAPELLELIEQDEFEVVIENDNSFQHPAEADPGIALRLRLFEEIRRRPGSAGARRLVLRFLATPLEIVGGERVTAIRVADNELVAHADGALRARAGTSTHVIDAGLVFRSVGYRGRPPAGLPFDAATGVVPNRAGRVFDPRGGDQYRGVYVAGWLKRGPRGVIGSNKPCSRETVDALLQDAAAGKLECVADRDALDALLAECGADRVDYKGWKAIDEQERLNGLACGRPRVKLVEMTDLLAAARAPARRRAA
nr:FAD-dependent oxidoreductase [Solimonas terrae]